MSQRILRAPKYWALLFLLPLVFVVASLTACAHPHAAAPRDTNGGVAVPAIPEPTYARWSLASSWPGGHKPLANEAVTIPAGVAILLDETPPDLGGLTVEGTLAFDDSADRALRASWIMVHGRLRVGTPANPFTHQAVITLTDTDMTASVMSMGTRGLLVMGGVLELVGVTPVPAWTHLGAHAGAGASSLTLAESANWRVGDQLAIAPTDRYAVGHTEVTTVTRSSGASLGIATPLLQAHFGERQSFGGVSLDERAEVANLTRNIIVEGPDDATFRDSRFGAHIMVMRGSLARIDGVALRRVGQAGRLGRYPIHFHRVSYADDGSDVGDTLSYVRNVAVSGSMNRCIVLHGTNGVSVFNDVCHDIKGHAFFLEDAIERRNVFEYNLALGVRNPRPADTLLLHEGDVFQGGSSGFWMTNPDNVLRHNVAADAEGNGFWLSYPEHPLGTGSVVPITPVYMPFGVFEDNAAHSNKQFGLNFDWVSADDAGTIIPFKYQPFVDGHYSDDYDRRIDCVLDRLTSYKNDAGALWNRVERLRMRGFMLADNPGTAFTGSSTNCTIASSVVIGTSANSAVPLPAGEPPSGAASYHSQCDIVSNTFVNLPFVPDHTSGAFRTDDYYVRAVDRGLVRNHDNHFSNAHPGYRTPLPAPSENYVLAGALWDPNGLWGPAGRYWVYDLPFLTAGSTCTPVAPAGQNGMSCAGPYYGVGQFVLDGSGDPFMPLMPISITRLDAGNAVFAVGDGNDAPKLGWMRHFAMVRGGTYALRFPGSATPTDVTLVVDDMLTANDFAILAVEFQGGIAARAYVTTWGDVVDADSIGASDERASYMRRMTAAPSLAAVVASSGDRFFQDSANDLVYLRVAGGLPFPFVPNEGSDEDIYRPMQVRITGP